jgi:hypothetical protein
MGKERKEEGEEKKKGRCRLVKRPKTGSTGYKTGSTGFASE